VIKVHRRVPRDDYFAIAAEAKAQGIAVAGHIPVAVTPEEASDAGQLIEHVATEGTGRLRDS
jgi:superfamily II RNA helicase